MLHTGIHASPCSTWHLPTGPANQGRTAQQADWDTQSQPVKLFKDLNGMGAEQHRQAWLHRACRSRHAHADVTCARWCEQRQHASTVQVCTRAGRSSTGVFLESERCMLPCNLVCKTLNTVVPCLNMALKTLLVTCRHTSYLCSYVQITTVFDKAALLQLLYMCIVCVMVATTFLPVFCDCQVPQVITCNYMQGQCRLASHLNRVQHVLHTTIKSK